MRSDLIFGALTHVNNRYELCQLASKATRKLHKPNTRLQDTTNEVLDRFKDTVPMDEPSKPWLRRYNCRNAARLNARQFHSAACLRFLTGSRPSTRTTSHPHVPALPLTSLAFRTTPSSRRSRLSSTHPS